MESSKNPSVSHRKTLKDWLKTYLRGLAEYGRIPMPDLQAWQNSRDELLFSPRETPEDAFSSGEWIIADRPVRIEP
jgi:hypothetical protein